MTALLERANGGSLEDVYLNLTSTTPVDSSPGHLKELS
jgi:hypothetical protein